MSRESWYNCVVAPVVTEKATLVQQHNQVVFRVAKDATKAQIKAAIEGLYAVQVEAVNTIVRKGKRVRFRGVSGQRKSLKHAYVTLKEGHSIDPIAQR